MRPQDIFAFADVAARAGCTQFSDWRVEDVTFVGTLPKILAVMSYMMSF